jgi:hypothetical protein
MMTETKVLSYNILAGLQHSLVRIDVLVNALRQKSCAIQLHNIFPTIIPFVFTLKE